MAPPQLIFKSFGGSRNWMPSLVVMIVIISFVCMALVSECFPLPDPNGNTDSDGDVIMEDAFDNSGILDSKANLDLNLAL